MNIDLLTAAPLKTRISASVIEDYAAQTGLAVDFVQAVSRELEKFLWLTATTEVSLAPSPSVDALWHDFILHTRDYIAFCDRNFGKIVHHVPQRGITPDRLPRYKATVAAIEAAFGSLNSVIWPHSEQYYLEVCESSSDCNSCKS
jgi:hypothetical protein